MEPLGVVLTAGLGTRLRPLTPATPKPLAPLLDRPLIAWALDLVAGLGAREAVVVAGPDDAATPREARARAPGGLAVSAAVQREPRGSGDALAAAGSALDGRAAAVLAVDSVLTGADPGLLAAFEASGADAGLLLRPVEDPRAFGVAVLDGDRVTALEEKPERPRSNLALVGLWLLAPAAVERVRTRPHVNAKGESDLTATVADLLAEGGDVRGWVHGGEWLDGGTLAGLLDAQARLLPAIADAPPPAGGDNALSGLVSAAGARVRGSRIEGPALIGEGATVERCRIAASVVGAGATIEDAELTRALVAPGARLRGGRWADVVVTAGGAIAGPGAPDGAARG